MLLWGLALAMTLLCMPLAIRMDAEQGLKLCCLAGGLSLLLGTTVLVAPVLFPVAETYLMVVSLGLGLRMLLSLIACGIVALTVGLAEGACSRSASFGFIRYCCLQKQHIG